MRIISIIGAGSWGTALAVRLAANADSIQLWTYEPDICAEMLKTRENSIFLPGFSLPENVHPTSSLPEAISDAEVIVIAVPSQHVRSLCKQIAVELKHELNPTFVSATKGLEPNSLLRMSQVISESFHPKLDPRFAVISGPTFAREVAHGAPTALVVASEDEDLARQIQDQFSSSSFRLYTNSDVVGVEIGGSVKNVIAIAAGVCDGLGLGSNPIAALVTRGLNEISHLACALGGRRETLAGLAGLGDLVLTCTGTQSRNRTVGYELGKGRTLTEILGSMRMVAEGINTTAATVQLASKLKIEMPITEQMYAMLYKNKSPNDAVRELMERALKSE